MTSISELQELLRRPEGVNSEFKEAKGSFDKNKLADYCAASILEIGVFSLAYERKEAKSFVKSINWGWRN